MKILFLGDIVGQCGRRAVKEMLPLLKTKYQPDLIIANSENAAHGKGLTLKIFHELLSYGIDVLTMGNHAYAKANMEGFISDPRIVFPANYLQEKANSSAGIEILGQKICVLNLLGKVFMDRECQDPKEVLDSLLTDKDTLYILDMHAETSGEKLTFLYAYKDRLTALIGTHTHVQTADETILPRGTGYITDCGMAGAKESVLGMDVNTSIKRLAYKLPAKYEPADGPGFVCGIIFETDKNGRCTDIKRFCEYE